MLAHYTPAGSCLLCLYSAAQNGNSLLTDMSEIFLMICLCCYKIWWTLNIKFYLHWAFIYIKWQIQRPHSMTQTPFATFLLFEQIIIIHFSFFGTSQRWKSHYKDKQFWQKGCGMLEGAQAVYLCHSLVILNEGYIKQLLLVCRMEGRSGRIMFRFKIRAIPGIWWCVFTF